MITIRTIKGENEYGSADITIAKGTPHTTMLLGIEMLIEALINDSSAVLTIDYVLEELKRIYERDNDTRQSN